MKPFDLQAALSGAKVVTRDGREVKIAGQIITGENEVILYSDKRILGLMGTLKVGCVVYNTIMSWDEKGRTYVKEDSNSDLFMAPTERKEWVVRDDTYGTGPVFYGPFDTLNEAKEFSLYRAGILTIHEITIIE